MTKSQRYRRRPIRLKRILMECGIAQTVWASAMEEHVSQFPQSTACTILNHNTWAGSVNKKQIISLTSEYLRSLGVAEKEIQQAFDVDSNTQYINPVGVTPAPIAAPQQEPDNTLTNELPENEMLSDAAKKHFHLFKSPFIDDVQKSEDVYLSVDQLYVKQAMHQTAKHGGFIAVIGESGAGKTTLRRDMLDRLSRSESNIRFVMPRTVDKTRLSAGAICDAIIADMNQKPRASLEAKARQIEKLLTESSRAGNSHVLMIEEAHDLTKPVLKYLKRFWELEDGFTKLIAIILIAQPELKNKLNEYANPEVREVARRCEIIELKPLNGNLEEYLELKFERVGKKLGDVFEADAYDAFRKRLSVHHGNSRVPLNMMYPLVVNNAVTKAMNLCAELGQPKVNAELIQEI